MNILVINGPNLNLLGTREPEKYGTLKLAEIIKALKQQAGNEGQIVDFQSNHEGQIIDFIQKKGKEADYILINAASLTHTSIGIRDALLSVQTPFIEIHISNIYQRESYRKKSYLADIAQAVMSGFGAASYSLALDYVLDKYKNLSHAKTLDK